MAYIMKRVRLTPTVSTYILNTQVKPKEILVKYNMTISTSLNIELSRSCKLTLD